MEADELEISVEFSFKMKSIENILITLQVGAKPLFVNQLIECKSI